MQSYIFEFLFWMIMIVIFVGVCIGIARDCSKINRETRRGRTHSDTTSVSRRRAHAKWQAHRNQSQTGYADIQLTMCPECEATILAEATVCPHCNSPQPICMVCNGSIVSLDATLSCPYCLGRAHRIHFLEYVKVKGTCPRCQADLDPHELITEAHEETPPTPNSGSQHLCMICNTAIDSTESILQCPHCEGKAHRIHFLEYVKVKGTCPRCQKPLDPSDLIQP